MEKITIDKIHHALKKDKTTESLENLLKSGLNPDTVITNKRFSDLEGKTLLQITCQDKETSKLKLLIKHGCHVNSGVYDVLVNKTLTMKLDLNVQDLTKTCLYYAICFGDANLVGILIEAGADVRIKCKDDVTALMHAVDNQNMDIIKLIIRAKNCDVNSQDIYGLSALHMAAIHGREDVIGLLLKRRARVDIKQCQGGTPLFLVSSREALGVLLRYGCDPNFAIRGDVTALSCVMKKTRDVGCILDLIKAGSYISKSYLDDILQNRPKILINNADILDLMAVHANKPISLKLQSTHVVRKSILQASNGVGLEFYKKANFLPLPNLLKEYIRSLGI